MKNYTLDDEDEKKFILKYEVKNGKMILYLASGEEYKIPYTKDNEIKVLQRMKEQVENSTDFEKISRRSAKIFSICTIVSTVISLALLIALLTFFKWYYIVGLIVAIFSTKVAMDVANEHFETIKDIEKSKLVLEYGESLNKNICKTNVLRNVSEKTLDVIKKIPEGKPVFDINTIDSMSLEDLKLIRENIIRMEQFGFEKEEDNPTYQKVFKNVKKQEDVLN